MPIANSRCRSEFSFAQLEGFRSNIRVYRFHDNVIRVVVADGEPWLVFADVCKATGYRNPHCQIKRVSEEFRRDLEIGLKNTTVHGINRHGLEQYALCSQKEGFNEFCKWAMESVFKA